MKIIYVEDAKSILGSIVNPFTKM